MNLPSAPSRRLCAGALTATLAAVVGCVGPLRQVRVDRDPSVPLSPGATWTHRPHDEPSGPEADALVDNPIVHQRLERQIAAELAARGYRQVDDPEQATLLMDYHLGLKERQETVASTHPTGAWIPVTTCQDKILERPRPAPRDTARTGGRGDDRADRDRDRDRADRRDSSARDDRKGEDRRGDDRRGDDRKGEDRRGDDRKGDDRRDSNARARVCTTKLVWGPYGPPETSYRTFTYREGTIVVDLIDRASGLVAWRVVGTRRLTVRDESEDVLHQVAQRLMRDLPAAGR